MSFRFKSFVTVAALIATSQVVMAQGVPGGMERGARDGERAAGPVGAAVGAAVGGVVGGVASVLGVDDRPASAPTSKAATSARTPMPSRSPLAPCSQLMA